MSFLKSKKALALVVAVVAVAVAAVGAYAYFTSGASGTGTAGTGGPTALTIVQKGTISVCFRVAHRRRLISRSTTDGG